MKNAEESVIIGCINMDAASLQVTVTIMALRLKETSDRLLRRQVSAQKINAVVCLVEFVSAIMLLVRIPFHDA